jgi:flavin-dependent dehydrogenase
MKAWDVAVVGGGISGSTAAALLGRQGLRVVLFEKGQFPRQKVCGEFLSPEGAEVLGRLGVWPAIFAHRPPSIHGVIVTAAGRMAQQKLPVSGWGVSRRILDHLVWDYAKGVGVTSHDHSTVQQVEGDWGRGFSLTVRQENRRPTAVRARAVLCATGRQWKFSAQRGRPQAGSSPRFVGLKTYFRGIPFAGQVELHTIRHGYCGLVEVTGDVGNLCCWVEAGAFREAGGSPATFLASALGQSALLQSRLGRAEQVGMPWSLTSIADRRAPAPVEEGIWNIGDRAAMVAPLTGDGMGMALCAAEMAVTSMLKAFRGQLSWEEAAAEYTQRWRQAFLPRLRWGQVMEGVLLRPRWAPLACMTLNWLPSLMDLLYYRTRQVSPSTDAVMGIRGL